MQIVRESQSGQSSQTIQIPLSYSSKSKWVQRIQEQPDLDGSKVFGVLPRMAFELGGLTYDNTRKLARMGTIGTESPAGSGIINRNFTPVPYNVSFSLYIMTNTQEDGLQIIEQILPSFAPELTLTISAGASGSGMTQNVPIILTNVLLEDDFDGSFETRRLVTWTLSFTAKVNLYGGTAQIGVINKVNVYINVASKLPASILPTNVGDLPVATYTAAGSGGVITSESWLEGF
jgi:hypothetical protein